MIRQFLLAIAASALMIWLTWLISLAHADGSLTGSAVLAALRGVGVAPGAVSMIGGGVYRLDRIDASVRNDRHIIIVVDVSRVP